MSKMYFRIGIFVALSGLGNFISYAAEQFTTDQMIDDYFQDDNFIKLFIKKHVSKDSLEKIASDYSILKKYIQVCDFICDENTAKIAELFDECKQKNPLHQNRCIEERNKNVEKLAALYCEKVNPVLEQGNHYRNFIVNEAYKNASEQEKRDFDSIMKNNNR